METVSQNKSFGGVQGVYTHASSVTNCQMTFSVFMPPKVEKNKCPVLWYLSGLTCTHANVMEKGEYRKAAAENGIAIICPDTSPRGDDVFDEENNWQMGKGAGFYVDASMEPWAKNYQMYSYIRDELPELIGSNFDVDMDRQAIFGHSMGGHGALTLALKNPDRYRSCSAFAPICNPSKAQWSKGALLQYLGADESKWREYDAVSLIEDGQRFPEFLVDQGEGDQFLNGLMPEALEAACKNAAIPLTLRMQNGYDHSYYFISTFMEDHIYWHCKHLLG